MNAIESYVMCCEKKNREGLRFGTCAMRSFYDVGGCVCVYELVVDSEVRNVTKRVTASYANAKGKCRSFCFYRTCAVTTSRGSGVCEGREIKNKIKRENFVKLE